MQDEHFLAIASIPMRLVEMVARSMFGMHMKDCDDRSELSVDGTRPSPHDAGDGTWMRMTQKQAWPDLIASDVKHKRNGRP